MVNWNSLPVSGSGFPEEARPQVGVPCHERGVRRISAAGRRRQGRPLRTGARRRRQEEQGRGDAGTGGGTNAGFKSRFTELTEITYQIKLLITNW